MSVNLQEIYRHHVQSWAEHPGWIEGAKAAYKQDLANRIARLINAPHHVPENFPVERLEKALLALSEVEGLVLSGDEQI
jgi:predicted hydrolase (HD superfamily)